MAILPGLWLAAELYRRIASRRFGDGEPAAEQADAVHRYFRHAGSLLLVAPGIVIAANLWLALARDFGMAAEADLARVLNLVRAAVFILVGNAVPKILTPLAVLPTGMAGRQQAARRYLGRALVLGGVVLAATTLWAPLDVVSRTRLWIGLGCVLITLLLIVWMNLSPRSREA